MDKQGDLVVVNGDNVEKGGAWVGEVLAIGAVVGALTGLGAAYLIVQRSKKRNETPSLNAIEGIKLALLVFGLLRQVSLLGGNEK